MKVSKEYYHLDRAGTSGYTHLSELALIVIRIPSPPYGEGRPAVSSFPVLVLLASNYLQSFSPAI